MRALDVPRRRCPKCGAVEGTQHRPNCDVDATYMPLHKDDELVVKLNQKIPATEMREFGERLSRSFDGRRILIVESTSEIIIRRKPDVGLRILMALAIAVMFISILVRVIA